MPVMCFGKLAWQMVVPQPDEALNRLPLAALHAPVDREEESVRGTPAA